MSLKSITMYLCDVSLCNTERDNRQTARQRQDNFSAFIYFKAVRYKRKGSITNLYSVLYSVWNNLLHVKITPCIFKIHIYIIKMYMPLKYIFFIKSLAQIRHQIEFRSITVYGMFIFSNNLTRVNYWQLILIRYSNYIYSNCPYQNFPTRCQNIITM